MKKISIITVCYNSEKTIARTIASVQCQNYKNYEHLIIDGLSKDKTLSIVEENADRQTKYFCERDNGIYDAMNKGLTKCSGDYVIFLNSDDEFKDSDVLNDINEQMIKNVDIILSNVQQVNNGKVTRTWKPELPSIELIKRGWQPPHPGVIMSRKLTEAVGKFNTKYEISADFDYILRGVLRANTIIKLNRVIVNMNAGGESTKFVNIIKGNKNIVKSLKSNQIDIKPFTYIINRWGPKIIDKILCAVN